tara:strand:+ start:13146 stop:14963 length:1818 start_codon:yes stop_codon:yes gene_type:complete
VQEIFLLVLGVSMIALGLVALVSPSTIFSAMKVKPESVAAYSEIKGLYGGVHLLFGLFMVASAVQFAWQLPALYLAALMGLGYVLGRVISLVKDGSPGKFSVGAGAGELVAGTIALVLILGQNSAVAGEAAVAGGKVNQALWDFNKRYDVPQLVEAGDRVHVAFNYDYSNFAFIEGDDGVILIDAGFFPGAGEKALADYRKITDKPIVAVIYTHIHTDHTGGAAALLADSPGGIPVYAPSGWRQGLAESVSAVGPMVVKRAFSQVGLFLPSGADGTVGTGIGRSPRMAGIPELVPPTIDISEPTEITVAGVRMQLLPAGGDVEATLWIWLPEERLLFAGDILGGTFPYIETVRMELERDPREFIASFNHALALQPDYLVAGHGRVLLGAEDVRDVLSANGDVTEFMVDQVDRLYARGYTPDRIIDELRLPLALANHPDLQPHYHRVEWIIRTMFVKRGGFMGEMMDIVTLTRSQEAARMVKLIGGEAAAVAAARAALAEDDPRWAARLASNVLEVNKNNEEALALRLQAYQRIAAVTDSANERNYLLTEIKTARGEIDWKKILTSMAYKFTENASGDQVLATLKARFRAEAADGLSFVVRANIAG